MRFKKSWLLSNECFPLDFSSYRLEPKKSYIQMKMTSFKILCSICKYISCFCNLSLPSASSHSPEIHDNDKILHCIGLSFISFIQILCACFYEVSLCVLLYVVLQVFFLCQITAQRSTAKLSYPKIMNLSQPSVFCFLGALLINQREYQENR